MADFNRSFLDHIKKSEQEREKELIKISSVRNKLSKYPGEKLLRKYKHRVWHKKLAISRKKISKFKRDDIARLDLVKKTSWSKENKRKYKVNSRQSFETTLLPEIGPCTAFSIAEIGTEVNGNRNNGNSPFNSSSSCNSPPDTHLFNRADSSSVSSMGIEKNTCQKCRIRNSEQNNNTDLRCTCINMNVGNSNIDFEQKHSGISTDSENGDSEPEGVDQKSENGQVDHSEPMSETLEPFIDVESLDDSGEVKIAPQFTKSSDHITEMSENGIDNEPVQYIGSKLEQSKSASNKQPIDWQQQFMSFLSSSTTVTDDQGDVEVTQEGSKSHSLRRKRSRKVRQSLCPCCIGSSHGHQKDRDEDLVRYRKPHSTMRSRRKFIRDMTQLVSLRNKVMEVCKVLFPKCVSEIFNYANPESEDVDKCVDQMISILHNAHQQFLQNLNSKTEKNLNNKTGVKLCKKFKSSKRQGNLQYDQTNSSEYMVSIFDSIKPVENVSSETIINDLDSEKTSPPPIYFCPQTDQLKEKSEPPEILKDICLPENEGIVYAIPVENGIAFPEQTQVLMTGKSDPTDCYNESVFSEDKNKLPIERNKEQNRMLSEADSGIVNDHDLSSPEEADKSDKNNVFHKTCPLWDGTFTKSKTSPVSAKSEHTAANIFDLLASYTPTKSVHKNDKSESETSVLDSSQDMKKADDKSPVKGGDRNIFDSLFNMNISSNVSNNDELTGHEISPDVPMKDVDKTEDKICDQEIQGFYLPLNEPLCEEGASVSMSIDNRPKSTYVEVYDPAIVLCKKPKICLHAFKEKLSSLIKWLLPEITFEKSFLKNTDNLVYVLDALVLCNKKQ